MRGEGTVYAVVADIDNVQDVSGQWWKFQSGMRAEGQPDGTVTFEKRPGIILPRHAFPIERCGEE